MTNPVLEQLIELSKRSEEGRLELQRRLERREKKLGKRNSDALEAADQEHKRIRHSAEQVLEEAYLHEELENKKREVERVRAIEQHRQAVRATELQKEEEVRRQARLRREEEQRREDLRRAEEEEAARARAEAAERKKREEDGKRKAQEEDARRKAREEEEDNIAKKREEDKNAGAAAQNAGSVNGTSSSSAATGVNGALGASTASATASEVESRHQQFLELHQRLKSMRKTVVEQCKSDKRLKAQVGDWRREIRKFMGQVTADRQARAGVVKRVKDVLSSALQIRQPSIDVRPYIIRPMPESSASTTSETSAIFLYEINIFAKAVISQFVNEASVSTSSADSMGIVASSVFAAPDLQPMGVPLIDILLAKLHRVCPLVFGISGRDDTEAGRKRLGWWRDAETGKFVSEQRHNERMTGLGAGFAAISLRNFSRVRITNPFPPENFWRALAYIVNTEPSRITQTHFVVLKAMLENQVPTFVDFYGPAAKAALRCAILTFPKKGPQGSASTALETLPAILKKDFGFVL